MRRLYLTLAAVLTVCLPQVASAQLDAKASFQQRQDELVELARVLGELHRLRQLCERGSDSNLFRVRMQELIGIEAPITETRLAMVAAFNAGYRDESQVHLSCSGTAQSTYERKTETASRHVNNLRSPL